MPYELQQCDDCWRTFSTNEMEYDGVSDEWLCYDCFEERKSVLAEKDWDEV